MPRYFIRITYKGTNYHGWQVQPNATTVQKKLNYALSTFLRESIDTIGAGRTDTGVHASYFIAHFDSIKENLQSTPNLIHKLNCILPSDITAYSIKRVDDSVNARFDATSRTYNYFIHTTKNSYINDCSYHFKGLLAIERIKEALPILFEHTDFTSFSKLHTDVKTNNCTITRAEWLEYAPNQYVFVIQADRFLRNMVRAIVGTLLEVGKGKITPEQVHDIIRGKDRALAGTSAPSQGLFLAKIDYPANLYEEDANIEECFPRFVL
ncbi:tRNA pseudouridine(38-40) synthase TruA [uncultured Acetobacteroides sp.]|uniref:tRNA pseudouridine(38-40) synthase TruA n=1 Tax=uncultured Acetobacteroides sp. TaxID=1760811 RepID=UPI0029F550E1|nr:tRNA pseudouridine(38-40) synthase TruA [uncultured Acetobacteroides sp.]